MGRLLHDWGRNRNDGGGLFIEGAYYTSAGGELFWCKKSPGETFACKNPPRGRISPGKIPPVGEDFFFFLGGGKPIMEHRLSETIYVVTFGFLRRTCAKLSWSLQNCIPVADSKGAVRAVPPLLAQIF